MSSLFDPILKMYPPKSTILNVDFGLKLRIYRSLKSLICLKWILKNLSTTLHTHGLTALHSRSVPLNLCQNIYSFLYSRMFEFWQSRKYGRTGPDMDANNDCVWQGDGDFLSTQKRETDETWTGLKLKSGEK